MVAYDEDTDYCGPEGEWTGKFVSNKPWGVPINRCCWRHDHLYRRGGTGADRLRVDKRFRGCIQKRLEAKWWIPKFLARMVAQRYYIGVRVFGSEYFNYRE